MMEKFYIKKFMSLLVFFCVYFFMYVFECLVEEVFIWLYGEYILCFKKVFV